MQKEVGPSLNSTEVQYFRNKMVSGDKATVARFLYKGRNLSIISGELQKAGINVMHQVCYWNFTEDTAREILAVLRAKVHDPEKLRLITDAKEMGDV